MSRLWRGALPILLLTAGAAGSDHSTCSPVSIAPADLVGAVSYSASSEAESVRVIYRVNGRKVSASLTLLKSDLPAFRQKIDSLLREDTENSDAPRLVLNRERLSDGSCFTTIDLRNP